MSAKKEKDLKVKNIHWDLSDLFDSLDDPRIDEIWTKIELESKAFVDRYRGKLADLSPNEMQSAFKILELIYDGWYKVDQYGRLLFAVDTSDEKVKAFIAANDDKGAGIENLLVFFDLELGQLDGVKIDEFIDNCELSEYSYYLRRIKEKAKYHLSEKEEQVINLKNLSGVIAFKKLYSEFTSSFEFEIEIDGHLKKVNGAELRALRQHEDRGLRNRAMKMFFDHYEKNSLIISSIYNSVVKNFATEKELRGYKSAISVRNVGNDLSDESVEALHQATNESYALVQRYYKLKAKLLGIPDMTLSDIYAPMPDVTKPCSYPEAKKIVLDAFAEFDKDFFEMAEVMFDESRIDAPVAPTKRGGAFCSSSTPEMKPYVLLNFLGKQRDVATMAHELGHAIHFMYSGKQNIFNFHAILPLAETASVFCEMVVTDYLLKNETDRDVKISIITRKLEDIFATSHRQNMFSNFEKRAHAKIAEGLQSPADLCNMYREELERMFGDSVKITDEYQWEWSSIPHIYSVPFYVYAYNFANLLVMSLYGQYKEEGESFKKKFKAILEAGCSLSPTEIAAIAGIDINDAAFWAKSFKVVEGLIDELEELLKV